MICSGAIYSGEPATVPSRERWIESSSARVLTRPKSSNLVTSYRPPRYAGHEVRRLDIAVDQAGIVPPPGARRTPGASGRSLGRRHGAESLDQLGQAQSGQVFHHIVE